MVLLDFSYDYDLTMRIDRAIEVPDSGPLNPIGDYSEYQGEWNFLKNAPPRVGSFAFEKGPRPTIYLDLGIDRSKKPPRGEELFLMWIKERGEWVGIKESSHLEGQTFGDYKDYEGPYALHETHALKILEVYGIPEGTFSPEKVLHTYPSELERVASERK